MKNKKLLFGVMFTALMTSPLMIVLAHNSPKMNAVHADNSAEVGDTFTDENGINYEITAVGDTNTVKVGDNASFEGTSATIPETVNYNNITFGVTGIAECAFWENSNLTEITIPSSVTFIDRSAFESCTSLTNVVFGEGSKLESIRDSAFVSCPFTEFVIPKSVTYLGGYAFSSCEQLSIVKILASEVPSVGNYPFYPYNKLEKIYVPENSVDAYKAADVWSTYKNIIEGFHTHSIKETHYRVEPLCETPGHEEYYECSCGKYFTDEALTQEIENIDIWLAEDGDGYLAPLGHDYGTPTYTWNEETHECTASHKCQRDGCTETQSELASIENGKVVYVKDFDATCTANEKGHYEATFTVQEFEKQATSMFDIPNTAKGHDYGTPTYTWNEDYTKCTATATCSHGDSTITNEGTITVEDGYAVATFEDDIFETQRVKLPEPAPEKSGLSGGAVAGISVGAVAGVALISYAVMFVVYAKTGKGLKFLFKSFDWLKKLFKMK